MFPKHSWCVPHEMPDLVKEHESHGRYVSLNDGTSIFVRDQQPDNHNPNMTVVMVHGVPASSFLYRKFFDPLVAKGYRAIAMDLPGLGLSDKPLPNNKEDYYSWPNLATKLAEVLNHKDLQLFSPQPPQQPNNSNRIHLVLHDIGGPIAALYAAQHPDQVASMTVLDTLLDIQNFRPPFPMCFFPVPLVGTMAVRTLTPWVFRQFMYLRGVADRTACTHDEALAWVWLLRHHKGGTQSFLTIMKSFPSQKSNNNNNNNNANKKQLTHQIHQQLAVVHKLPLQIVWAQGEVAIPPSQCRYVQDNFHVLPENVHHVPGRHFLQLESADLIVEKIHDFLQTQTPK